MLRHLLDIPIPPNKPSEFDHADVHAKTGRVFVAHTREGRVEVIDGEEMRHLKTIGGCEEGSGVLCAQDDDLVFAASRATGRILVIDANSLGVKNALQIGSRPNGLAWDSRRKNLLVADVRDSTARLANLESEKLIEATKLKGRPRWTTFDKKRDRFLVNIKEPPEVAVLSASSGEETYSLAVSAAGPHGMALDEQNDRIYVACDAKQLVVLDSESGKEVSKIGISGPPDVLWLNSEYQRVYCACGEPGAIDVIDTRRLSKIEQVKTEPGAHTFTFDVDRQRLYSFYPESCCTAIFEEA